MVSPEMGRVSACLRRAQPAYAGRVNATTRLPVPAAWVWLVLWDHDAYKPLGKYYYYYYYY